MENSMELRVENIPRIHIIWPPRTDSRIHEITKVWSWAVQRQDHRSSSCQCSTTLYGEKKEVKKHWKVVITKLWIMLADFLAVIGHYSDLDLKRSGTELTLTNLMVFGIPLLKTWCLNSQSKGRGKKTIHFNISEQNVELILRIVMSANQLSIYGAVAEICTEVSQRYHGFRETRSTCSIRFFGNDGNS